MANLRIVYDNAANRSTITASSTAGNLAATNLLTDTKSEVWRSTDTSASLTMTWTNGEIVGMVALPFCSLTSQATIRVRGYTNTADVTPLFDTGTQLACAGSSFGQLQWGVEALGVNAYSYGGAAYAVIWFGHQTVRKLLIDLVDTTNTLGYLEAARIVTGAYWSPVNNCEYGAEVSVVDTSKNERSDAGDLRTDRGTLHKTLSLDVTMMPNTDRNTLWNILRGSGIYRPIYLSLTPENSDSTEEQAYQVYGKWARQASIRYQFLNQFSAQLEIEEV